MTDMTHAELADLFLEREYVTPAIDEALYALEQATDPKTRSHLLWVVGDSLQLKVQAPEAIPYLTEAIELDPQNHRAWYSRGAALERVGQPDAAMDDLRKSQELDPTYWRSAFLLGDMLMERKQWEAAAEAFGKAIPQNPDRANLRAKRGECLLALERKAEAVEDLKAAVHLDDPYSAYLLVERAGQSLDSAEALGAWAYDREKRRMTDDAAAAYQQALAAPATDPKRKSKLVGRLATMLRVAKRNDEAKKVLDDWLAEHPQDVDVLDRRAWHHYQLSQDDACEADYRRILEIDPDHTAALVGMARLCGVTKRGAEGVPFADKAIAADPYNREALFHGGVCAALAKQEDKGRTLFDRAHRLGDRDAAKHRRHYFGDETANDAFAAGLAMGNNGNKVGAAEAFEKAAKMFEAEVKVKGDEAWRYMQKALGNVAFWYSTAHQRLDHAEAVSRKVALDYPAHYDNLITLAGICKQNNNTDGAIEIYERATTLNPTEGRAFYNRALIRMDREEFAEAAEDYGSAAKNYSRKEWKADAFFGQGRAFAALGQWEDAYEAYSTAGDLGHRNGLIEAVRAKSVIDP